MFSIKSASFLMEVGSRSPQTFTRKPALPARTRWEEQGIAVCVPPGCVNK
jgi:hypothetical protein